MNVGAWEVSAGWGERGHARDERGGSWARSVSVPSHWVFTHKVEVAEGVDLDARVKAELVVTDFGDLFLLLGVHWCYGRGRLCLVVVAVVVVVVPLRRRCRFVSCSALIGRA